MFQVTHPLNLSDKEFLSLPIRCEYACVNLSMLRSHKKSHFRHLLFKCSNCSFESKQYHSLQEHVQIEGHQPHLDESIEEFLKEYSSGSLTSFNTTMTNNNPTLLTIPKTNTRLPVSKKRKTMPNISRMKRISSTSSIDSSPNMISPLSTDEHPIESIHPPSNPFNQSLLASIGQFQATSGQVRLSLRKSNDVLIHSFSSMIFSYPINNF